MFGFLKKKLKSAIEKFTEEVEEEAEEEIKEEVKEEIEEKIEEDAQSIEEISDEAAEEDDEEEDKQDEEEKDEKKELDKEEEKDEERDEERDEDKDDDKYGEGSEEKPQVIKPVEEESVDESEKRDNADNINVVKKGFFSRFSQITISEDKFEELFWELELVLLENNVAVEVIEKIKSDLKDSLVGVKIPKKELSSIVVNTLKRSLRDVLSVEPLDVLSLASDKRSSGEPLIIAMIGVNGSGKTTTLAKLAHYFKSNGFSVVVAAADTFRAAAIQQLEEHANNLGVKLIKHDYGSDPAAVAFDAIKHAKAKGVNVVLIDSAGRLHSNDNLMNELKKLIRVNSPDLKVFVGEAITGNDCVEQAKVFDEMVGIDAVILAKADVDEKGGAAISVSYVTKKPILFLGVGQGYGDLKPFDPDEIINSLGF